MTVKFELEIEEAVALMQCATAGATAAQVLLGANARPMGSVFEKIQRQFNDQQATPPTARLNGQGLVPS